MLRSGVLDATLTGRRYWEAAALAIFVALTAPAALAQENRAPGPAGEPGSQRSQSLAEGAQEGDGGVMALLMQAAPQIAATDRYVYVLRGAQLSAFDTRTMRLTGTVTVRPTVVAGMRQDSGIPAPGPPPGTERTTPATEGSGTPSAAPVTKAEPAPDAVGATATPRAPATADPGSSSGSRNEPAAAPDGLATPEGGNVVRLEATDRNVYLLVGNELMAFEAGTLRPRGVAIVPERPLQPGTLDVPDPLER